MSKFNLGDKVTFTNDQGVKFTQKTITEIEHGQRGVKYYFTPSDSPWVPVREDQLSRCDAK